MSKPPYLLYCEFLSLFTHIENNVPKNIFIQHFRIFLLTNELNNYCISLIKKGNFCGMTET